AQVDPTGTVRLSHGCVPETLVVDSKWTMIVETDGGSHGQIFTAQVGADGRSDGLVYPAKQWPPSESTQ
ncbi:MAG: hypothetical protein ACRDQ0_12575, partial [Pseudonocardia sp.]